MIKIIKWVNASAGSGKTTAILNNIKDLINAGAEPKSILCLSFTNASANEMNKRYDLNENASPVFTTIHSFARSIMNEKMTLITDEVVLNNLIHEAIESCLTDKWMKFLNGLESDWSKLIEKVKFFMRLNVPKKYASYLANELNNYSVPDFKPYLSSQAILELRNNKMDRLVEIILSGDLELYMSNLVTSEFQINKRTCSEKMLSKISANVILEVNLLLKSILSFCINKFNYQNMEVSTEFSRFIFLVTKKYSEIKKQYGVISYDDIIECAIRNPDLSKVMHIKHIFVDEAQDTSLLQWKFLFSIIEEVLQHDECSIAFVADIKQIIFEFNGASHNLCNIAKGKLKEIANLNNCFWSEDKIDTCYRCPPVLLSLVDQIMSKTKYNARHVPFYKNKRGYIKIWIAEQQYTKKDDAPHTEWEVGIPYSMPKNIKIVINEIKRLVNSDSLNGGKVKYSDILILLNKRCANSLLLIQHLNEADIPISESPFYLNQEDMIREFTMIAEFVFNPDDDLAAASILKGPFFAWSSRDLEQICFRKEKSIWSLMNQSEDKKISDTVQKMSSWFNLSRNVIDFYAQLFFESEYGQKICKMFQNEVSIFWETVIEFSENSLNLFDFIEYMGNLKKTLKIDVDGIRISTIHGSKGTEAKIVFLFDSSISLVRNSDLNLVTNKVLLTYSNSKLYKITRNNELLNQELEGDRLMYVALTRSQEQLYVIPPISSDKIAPKSIYASIIQEIASFDKIGEFEYELIDLDKRDSAKAMKIK